MYAAIASLLPVWMLLQPRDYINGLQLLFVGGKGGVGKTTVASALAVGAAQAGRRVLLISTDPAHSLADAFDRPIGAKPVTLQNNLTVLELDPDREVDAYLSRVLEQMRQSAGPDQF